MLSGICAVSKGKSLLNKTIRASKDCRTCWRKENDCDVGKIMASVSLLHADSFLITFVEGYCSALKLYT